MRTKAIVFSLWMVTAVLMAAALSGCSRTVAEKASESDSNGYECLDCKAKFYTDQNVFAEKCPDCKSVRLETVYGYVCEVNSLDAREDSKPGCGSVTLGLRGAHVKCQQCGASLSKVSLPSGAALAKWGATKASKDKVLIPR